MNMSKSPYSRQWFATVFLALSSFMDGYSQESSMILTAKGEHLIIDHISPEKVNNTFESKTGSPVLDWPQNLVSGMSGNLAPTELIKKIKEIDNDANDGPLSLAFFRYATFEVEGAGLYVVYYSERYQILVISLTPERPNHKEHE